MTKVKVKMEVAKQLINMFDNIYQEDRTEWFHVRTTDNAILMEVNLYYSYVRVYVDYARDCYVMLNNVEGFDIHNAGDVKILRVKVNHNPICPFCVDLEED